MLELVSLSDTESTRRIRNYSLGMRQRLGIAHALLGDPSVLILDEPANGLDPAGIRWMRGLLKDYADRGGTVLLSSHLLNEVELVADEMILIGRGQIVASGTKQELLAGRAGGATHVTALDVASLSTALEAAGLEVSAAGDGLRVETDPVNVGQVAADKQLVLTDLRPAEGGLENLFLELTADTQRESITHAKESRYDRRSRRPRRPPSTSPRPRRCPSGASSRSSCARCTTPAPASGCSPSPAGCWCSRSASPCSWSALDDDVQVSGQRVLPDHDDPGLAARPGAGHHQHHQRVEPAHRPGDLHPRAAPHARRRGPSSSPC